MKESQKSKFPYTAFETYCLRTPILPLEFLNDLVLGDEVSDTILIEKLRLPVVAEAIYLSSPELYQQLIKWSNNEITDLKKSNRLKSSLLKYLTRMASRCTPFGLFASLGTGTLSRENNIVLQPHEKFQKNTLFDMEFLVAFGHSIANRPHIRNQLLFFPNSSLYGIGKRYRYVEYYFKNKLRVYTLESIVRSEYLENLLKTAQGGATIDMLVQQLVLQDIDKTEASNFIEELIDNQILISELAPTVIGKDFLSVLKDKLALFSGAGKELRTIVKLQSFLTKLDKKIGTSIERYLPLKNYVSKLGVPFDPKYLLQTDTFSKYKSNTLSYTNVKKVKQAIAFFNKITKQGKIDLFKDFKTAFRKRYAHQKMPLLQVLDVETGIGYGQNPTNLIATPFLDDIAYHKRDAPNYTIDHTPLFRVLQKKLSETLSKNETTIELTEDDFPNTEYDWINTADTISTILEIVSENGREKLVLNGFIEHASRFLGRFGHGDKELMKLLMEITAKEAEMNPDLILAEIAHLPEARTGNILRRPTLREFEIPYLGKSNLSLEQQIPLKDLLISIENNLVLLHSKKFKKRVLPRLSNAHNFNNSSLPVYQFLCELQYQEQQAAGFVWPSAFGMHQFLPTVTYKDCIFSKARWNISKKDVEVLFEKVENKKIMMAAIKNWRFELNLPDVVQLVDNDNTLVVHLKNYSSARMLIETIRNRPSFVLEEFLPPLIDKNKSKSSFCKQLILSFYNHSKLNSHLND